MNNIELKTGTEVTINVPFTYEIGEFGYATGKNLKTITDCKNEVLAELENGMSGDVLMNVQTDSKPTPAFIKNMDWKQLQEQKLALMAIIKYSEENIPLLVSELNGILHVIDAVQDCAVDELGISEDVVFKMVE